MAWYAIPIPLAIYSFNPLEDPRWSRFVEGHPQSSAFHTAAWLSTLQRTYGYRAVAFTTCPPTTALANAVVFCRIESWLTGARLVSLPFSDHCSPLLDNGNNLDPGVLSERLLDRKLRYIEIRPCEPLPTTGLGRCSAQTYYLHQLDLTPSLDTLFRNCHKASTQRKIHRAAKENLRVETGVSPKQINAFYRLLVLTRRRHGLFAQPRAWVENLAASFGGSLQIYVAYNNAEAVSAILTLRHRDTLVYKYGCSDARFHSLGGVQLLFWTCIVDAKQAGLSTFDLGRSDLEDTGLITFKDRWGAQRFKLVYLRFGNSTETFVPAGRGRAGRLARDILRYLPAPVLQLGGLLYKHLG